MFNELAESLSKDLSLSEYESSAISIVELNLLIIYLGSTETELPSTVVISAPAQRNWLIIPPPEFHSELFVTTPIFTFAELVGSRVRVAVRFVFLFSEPGVNPSCHLISNVSGYVELAPYSSPRPVKLKPLASFTYGSASDFSSIAA